MFGRDILFAPIFKQGQTERKVYLPAGKWIRTSDKAEFTGNQTIVCYAKTDEFIAFVKEGSEVIEAF